MQYAKSNPKANRLQLVSLLAVSLFFLLFTNGHQLSEIASGVSYLHEFKIVHGDLKGVSPVFSTSFHPADK